MPDQTPEEMEELLDSTRNEAALRAELARVRKLRREERAARDVEVKALKDEIGTIKSASAKDVKDLATRHAHHLAMSDAGIRDQEHRDVVMSAWSALPEANRPKDPGAYWAQVTADAKDKDKRKTIPRHLLGYLPEDATPKGPTKPPPNQNEGTGETPKGGIEAIRNAKSMKDLYEVVGALTTPAQ